jgi:hypothetical protein
MRECHNVARFSLTVARIVIQRTDSNLNLPSDGAKAEHDAESKAATRRVARDHGEKNIHVAVGRASMK